MATMTQIAELAGVSRGTVDRVLNNRGGVSPDTAEKIRQIAQSIRYTPNKAARSLAALKHITIIGYLLPLEHQAFYSLVEEGIDDRAKSLEQFGVKVLKRRASFRDLFDQFSTIDRLLEEGATGLVICGFHSAALSEKLKQISEMGIAIVTSNSDMPDSGRISYVGSNAYKEGRTVGQLLSRLSPARKKLMIVREFDDSFVCKKRTQGLTEYLSSDQAPIDIVCDTFCNSDDFLSYSIIKDTLGKADCEINAIYYTGGGIYGACHAIEALQSEKRPLLICHDCTAQNVEMLKKGIVTVIIGQQPYTQGSKPLDIMYDWKGMGFKPTREMFYTDISINILENVSVYS